MTHATAARATARDAGLTHYTGSDCIRKHGGLRFVSDNQCVGCKKERNRSATKGTRGLQPLSRPVSAAKPFIGPRTVPGVTMARLMAGR